MRDPLQTVALTPRPPTVAAPPCMEKMPLERYVPPQKPCLVGLSRAELGEGLEAIHVAPAQRKMRVQQLWHWLYVRGATHFEQLTNVSREPRAPLDGRFTLAGPW